MQEVQHPQIQVNCLPTEIFRIIFFEWLYPSSLCYFDTAVVNRRTRSLFLNSLSRSAVLDERIITECPICINSYLQWIERRNLFITSWFLPLPRDSIFVTPFSRIKKLSVKDEKLLELCNSEFLETLELDVNLLKSCWRGLKCFDTVNEVVIVPPQQFKDYIQTVVDPNEVVAFLLQFTRLQYVSLFLRIVDDDSVATLSTLPPHVSIYLGYCRFQSEAALLTLCSRFNKFVAYQHDLPEESLAAMIDSAPRLESLVVCRSITVEVAERIAASASIKDLEFCCCCVAPGLLLSLLSGPCASHLRSLHLYFALGAPTYILNNGSAGLRDEELRKIASQCAVLEELSLEFAHHVTGSGLSAITVSCTRLKHLSLRGSAANSLRETELLIVLQPRAQVLESLDISHLSCVTDRLVAFVLNRFIRLETLHITGNRKLTIKGFRGMYVPIRCTLRCLEVYETKLSLRNLLEIRRIFPRISIKSRFQHKQLINRRTTLGKICSSLEMAWDALCMPFSHHNQ